MSEIGYLKSRIKAILIALDGIKYVFMTQKNTRIHAGFTVVVFLLGWLLKISRIEWITLLLVDIVSPEKNQAAKIGKDVSAGGVLIAAFVSILIGILIFGPRLWQWVMDILK